MLLKDRVCVVTGVGPGMGRQVSVALAEQGADVVLAARSSEYLDQVAAEVQALGRRAIAVPTDVTDKEQCHRLIDRAVEELGRVDVLVASAFRPDVFRPFEKVDLDEWRSLLEVNLFGALSVAQAAVPVMRRPEQAGGSIVFVGSMVVRRPMALQGGYAVSKGALLTATRVLASELGRHKIRVNAVVPGWMLGPSVESYLAFMASSRGVSESEIAAEIAADIPLGAIPTDREVAGTVVFLASDLSSAVTGQAVDANGGQVFH